MNTISSIKALLYKKDEESWPLVANVLKHRFPRVLTYSDDCTLSKMLDELLNSGVLSKEIMILKEFKGRFFQVCPKTQKMICCNYRLINTGFNCLYNCTYCYLQSYLNSSGIMLFSNMHKVFEELEIFFNSIDPNTVYRIGTGEYTDSLMIDEITGIGRMLIDLASQRKNVMLELKTKSCLVDHLLDIPNKGNAVIGFSLNSLSKSAIYEEGCATIMERLDAAKRASDAGFFVAFHFDPIIYTDTFESEYREIINLIFGITEPTIKITDPEKQNHLLLKTKIHDYVKKYGLMKISIDPDHIFYSSLLPPPAHL